MPYLKTYSHGAVLRRAVCNASRSLNQGQKRKLCTRASLYCFPTLGAKGGVQLGAGKITGNGILAG